MLSKDVSPSVTRPYSKHILKRFNCQVVALFSRGAINGDVKCRWYEKLQFSTNSSLYVRNNTRYGHSYYRMRIGNRTQAFAWYNF